MQYKFYPKKARDVTTVTSFYEYSFVSNASGETSILWSYHRAALAS